MSLPPQKMRELIFQLLYTLSFEQVANALPEKTRRKEERISLESERPENFFTTDGSSTEEELPLSCNGFFSGDEQPQELSQESRDLFHSEIKASSRRGSAGLLIAMVMREHRVSRRYVLEAYDQASKILIRFSELDPLLSLQLRDHPWPQLFLAEKTALRLAAYELLCEKTLPLRVVISEAVRIAKKFITPDAASLVYAALENLTALLPDRSPNDCPMEQPTATEQPIEHAL